MHTHTEKSKTTQPTPAFRAAATPMPARTGRGMSPEPQETGTAANQFLQRSAQWAAAGAGPDRTVASSAPAGHDLGRMAGQSGRRTVIQAKLTVNRAGDALEQEADSIAQRVMRMTEPRAQRAGATLAAGEGMHAVGERLQTKNVGPNDAGGLDAPPIVHEALSGSGGQLDDEARRFMEPRLGWDFGNVRVHADATAAAAARSVQARAFTSGRDIVFGAGEYAPGTTEGRSLLAHELVHVVQQGGVSRSVVQRNAIAAWSDAAPSDLPYFLSDKDQKKYFKQQKSTKTVKDPIKPPESARILNISATYHHYDKYPTPEGGTLTFDEGVVAYIQKEFRIGSTPGFWPNIKWKAKDGIIRDIGVRFNFTFTPHKLESSENNTRGYIGASMKEDEKVRRHQEENVILMRDIDKLYELGLNAKAIVDEAGRIGMRNFVFSTETVDDSEVQFVIYTPSKGGAPVKYRAYEDIMAIITAVRAEAKAQHLEAKLSNNVLGYGSENTVTFDTNKTAPTVKTFNTYEPIEGINDYKSHELKALEGKTEIHYDINAQRRRVAGVIAHEIGHDIGMGHTDFGVMDEHSEKDIFTKTETTIPDPFSTSTTVFNAGARVRKVTLETTIEPMTRENVQLLVNRLQSMTADALPRIAKHEGSGKASLEEIWNDSIPKLRALLDADDFENIFKNDLYAGMLAIPYQEPLLDSLQSKGSVVSDDAKAIRNGMKTAGRISYTDWKSLSTKARAYIKAETKRLIGDSFSGVTFFASEEERDAY